tara:strand:+ start:29016 stop:29243 length:228 start_codon:yes stop_codon:yes gene_type:complete
LQKQRQDSEQLCSLEGWDGHDLQYFFFRSCFPQQLDFTLRFDFLQGVAHEELQWFSTISITESDELNTLSTCCPQ